MLLNFKSSTLNSIIAALAVLTLVAYSEPFEFRSWNNKEGKDIEAKLDHVVDSDTIVLQAKNGGKRYTIKKITLSDDSVQYLDNLISETKKSILEARSIDGEMLYKGVALRMEKDLEATAKGKTLSLEVKGFRVSSEKNAVTLELESGVFAELRVNSKYDFFVNSKSLYFRSAVKDGSNMDMNYWWYYNSTSNGSSSTRSRSGDSGSGLNKDSVLVVAIGDSWKFRFSEDVKFRWGMIGVTEGPIVSDH